MYDCREMVDKHEIADICNLHLVSVGKRLAEGLNNTNIDTISHIATPNEKFTFSKISTEQVKQVIWKLVNNKATGVHDIPNRVLKDEVVQVSTSGGVKLLWVNMNNLVTLVKIYKKHLKHLKSEHLKAINYV